MRRDYFICIFLLCICCSLLFVCFAPIALEYGLLIPRAFSIFEIIMSWLFAVVVLGVIPVYSAVKKKFWFMAGLAVYGFFAYLPEWIIPGLAGKLQGDNASMLAVIQNFIWRAVYGMVKAPFAGMIPAVGEKIARGLSDWILPASVGIYVVVQLFRFYRDSYVADQLDPSRIVDSTAAENNGAAVASRRRETREAEVLGTVISAPVNSAPKTPDGKVVAPSANGAKPKSTSQVFPVNPNQPVKQPQVPNPNNGNGPVQMQNPVHVQRQIPSQGDTQRMPVPNAKPAIDSDTKVIHLGPPKGNN